MRITYHKKEGKELDCQRGRINIGNGQINRVTLIEVAAKEKRFKNSPALTQRRQCGGEREKTYSITGE